MNIKDYEIIPLEEDKNTYVEYKREDYDFANRYPINSFVSIKGRRDLEGKIDRLEEDNIIVKIFNQTYSVPPQDFDSIFYIHPQTKYNRYKEKLKNNM